MFEERAEYFKVNPEKAATGITQAQAMGLFVSKVQMQRRVAVLRHRFEKFDPSGAVQPTLRLVSQYHLHGQKLSPDQEAYRLRLLQAYRDGCELRMRTDGPDIFEQVQNEEHVGPYLDDYRKGLLLLRDGEDTNEHDNHVGDSDEDRPTHETWWAAHRRIWRNRKPIPPRVKDFKTLNGGNDSEDTDAEDRDFDGDDDPGQTADQLAAAERWYNSKAHIPRVDDARVLNSSNDSEDSEVDDASFTNDSGDSDVGQTNPTSDSDHSDAEHVKSFEDSADALEIIIPADLAAQEDSGWHRAILSDPWQFLCRWTRGPPPKPELRRWHTSAEFRPWSVPAEGVMARNEYPRCRRLSDSVYGS